MKNIVVMDQVVVKGPGYRSEDCKASKEAGSALARVKKVVSSYFFLLSGQDEAVAVGWFLRIYGPQVGCWLMRSYTLQLDNERKKLAQREPKVPKPVIPAVPAIPAFSGGPRKGG